MSTFSEIRAFVGTFLLTTVVPAHAQSIITVAGNGTAGFSGDEGPATCAMLDGPSRVFVDNTGNIYFSDSNNHRVRKVNPSQIISTIAGNGTASSTGDNGLAKCATLNFPRGVFLDGAGNIYIGVT
jgi:hypothetical protein